jgi:hypothetical protein
LVLSGLVIAALGVAVYLLSRLPVSWRLPGTISVHTDNFWIFIPLGASLLLSIILTIVINVIIRLR